MHDIDSTQGESDLTGLEVPGPESFEYNFEQDGETEFASESPFGEIEETELAEELLTIQSEEELDQFLGKLVKKAWRGVKKFAKSGVGRALGGALKGIAKKALPIVGGALGSFIPIPGVGTMIGRAAGTAAAICSRWISKEWSQRSRSLKWPSASCDLRALLRQRPPKPGRMWIRGSLRGQRWLRQRGRLRPACCENCRARQMARRRSHRAVALAAGGSAAAGPSSF